MLLHFYLRFSTDFGQTVFVSGNTPVLGDDDMVKALSLEYLDNQLWHGHAEISGDDAAVPVRYKYLVRQDKGPDLVEFGDDRIIEPGCVKKGKLVLIDTWNHPGTVENVFFSAAFQEVLLRHKKQKATHSPAARSPKKHTHVFRVKAPLIGENEILGISGSGAQLNEWDKQKILSLSKEGNWFARKYFGI